MAQEFNLPQVEVKALLEAGSHFGHRKRRWNPKMAPYIYGSKGDVHIMNLDKTKQMLNIALKAIADVAKSNGKILFVGTKKQASATIAEKAQESGQFYVNHRWLGGMLTNNLTVSNSIKTMESIEKLLADKESTLTKKEKLSYSRKLEKLYLSLNGVRSMKSLPDLMIIADTNKELIALKEAAKLGIPVVAIVDTNATLENVLYPIPANDDSIKSLSVIFGYIAEAINSARPQPKGEKVVKEDLTKGRGSANVQDRSVVVKAASEVVKNLVVANKVDAAPTEVVKKSAKPVKVSQDVAAGTKEEESTKSKAKAPEKNESVAKIQTLS